MAATWAAVGDVVFSGWSKKEAHWGSREKGNRRRGKEQCIEGITQVNCFFSFNSFLKVTNNDLGPLATHFADEKTEPQEK